jgi:hypothetical protein
MIVLGKLDDESRHLFQVGLHSPQEETGRTVVSGKVKKREVLRPIYPGAAEEWFENVDTGEIYYLLPPE